VSHLVPPSVERDGTSWDNAPTCPTPKTSHTNKSAQVGQVLEDSPKGERTEEELAALMEEASKMWS
jgi:hypothetical protein